MKNTIIILVSIAISLTVYTLTNIFIPSSSYASNTAPPNTTGIMSYHGNIGQQTQTNTYFRRVVFTGAKSQLVIMNIPPGGDVGSETHKYTEQTLFFLSGSGKGLLDDKEFAIRGGDVVVVVPGTKHNFINTGLTDLKLYTVYAPPNHIGGRIHVTKAEADADSSDEAIGETPPSP